MTWLFEQPLIIVFIGVVVVAILFACMQQTGRKGFFYAMIGAALLVVGLVALERLIVTDREQVKQTLHGLADAIEADDLARVQAGISPQSMKIRADAQHYMRLLEIKEVNIKRDLAIAVSADQNPPMAKAEFHATFVGGDKLGRIENQRVPRFFVVTFRKEQGRWLVRKYEMHDPREQL